MNLRFVLSALCIMSFMATFTRVDAGPVRFDQVVQILNANPSAAESSSFTRLRVASYYDGIIVADGDDDDDDDDKKSGKKQDDRVITETKTDIVTDDVCDCIEDEKGGKFPKWALLGLAAIPIAFILIKRKKDTPTPTPSIPITQTPTPTPTPPMTPTPTPPMMTPSPTPPEPVPEPVTILLFGTGLAGIGLAARRKFGKKTEDTVDEE